MFPVFALGLLVGLIVGVVVTMVLLRTRSRSDDLVVFNPTSAPPQPAPAPRPVASSRGDGLYEAWLTDTGSQKISVIKEVRDLTNLGLKEAKDAVEGGPYSLASGLTAEQAAKIQRDFAAVGATVDVR